ncbi:hypothetical protein V2J09_003298 [Rumex salicifolius]
MQSLTSAHWTALKRLLRYLVGSSTKGNSISASSPLTFHAYSDADWAGDKDDYVSTTGYLLYLGDTPISWSFRKQRSIARSSTEAEYKALADTASELLFNEETLQEDMKMLPYKVVNKDGKAYVEIKVKDGEVKNL